MNIKLKENGIQKPLNQSFKCKCGKCDGRILIIEFEKTPIYSHIDNLEWCPSVSELQEIIEAMKKVYHWNLENHNYCYRTEKKEYPAKLNMEVNDMNIENLFEENLKPEEVSSNIETPTKVKIISEGENKKTNYGDKFVLKIELENKMRYLRVNRQSWKCLKAAFGIETSLWIGKEVGLYSVPTSLQDAQGNVRRTINTRLL